MEIVVILRPRDELHLVPKLAGNRMHVNEITVSNTIDKVHTLILIMAVESQIIAVGEFRPECKQLLRLRAIGNIGVANDEIASAGGHRLRNQGHRRDSKGDVRGILVVSVRTGDGRVLSAVLDGYISVRVRLGGDVDVIGSLGKDEGATRSSFRDFKWSGGDESGGEHDESSSGEDALYLDIWRNRMKTGFNSALNNE